MPIRLLMVFVLAFPLSFTGCGDPVSVSPQGTNDTPDDDSDDMEETGPFAGWVELYEPLGDESFIRYRVVPAEYAPGDEVTFEAAVGSGYGPVDNATISYRCTSGSEAVENGLIPTAGTDASWLKLEPEGMYQPDYETGETTSIPGMKAPREEIYDGYMLHVAKFRIPVGSEVIEMRVQQPAASAGGFRIPATDFAFQAFSPTDQE